MEVMCSEWVSAGKYRVFVCPGTIYILFFVSTVFLELPLQNIHLP